jgi:hypothetical protein
MTLDLTWFLENDLKDKATKEKNRHFELYEKNLNIQQKTMTIVKRQITEWEKLFSNHISDKGLIFRTYKWLQNKLSNSSMCKEFE